MQGKKMELQPTENAIVIHPHLLQRFLKHGKNYANLLALYSFYIYHAQLQKTNQPLATDEFTRKGMNWAMDRVKKTKKILKEMKLIEVVQKQKYYYVHLFFIYTKKKIGEILGKSTTSQKESETVDSSPKKTEKKVETKQKASAPSMPPILTKWIEYCDKNGINYGKNNLTYWENKLKNRLTIDQEEGVYNAINKKWKDFYIVPIKESKYHKLLGKSAMMERDCDTLLNLAYRNNKYIYQFKNVKVTSTEPPLHLFDRCGYDKTEVKTAPIALMVKDKIMGMVKRF